MCYIKKKTNASCHRLNLFLICIVFDVGNKFIVVVLPSKWYSAILSAQGGRTHDFWLACDLLPFFAPCSYAALQNILHICVPLA